MAIQETRNPLIEELAAAIARQEGYGRPGTLPTRYRNPGAIRKPSWMPEARTDERGFVIFDSDEQGWDALRRVISGALERGESLREFITRYAPPTENDTETYIRNVASAVGIQDPDAPLRSIIELGSKKPEPIADRLARLRELPIDYQPSPLPRPAQLTEHPQSETTTTTTSPALDLDKAIDEAYKSVLEAVKQESDYDELARMIEETRSAIEQMPKDPVQLREKYWKDYVRKVGGFDPDEPGNMGKKIGFAIREALVNLASRPGERVWERLEKLASDDFRTFYAPQLSQSSNLLRTLIGLKSRRQEAVTAASSRLLDTLLRARNAADLLQAKLATAASAEDRARLQQMIQLLRTRIQAIGTQASIIGKMVPGTSIHYTITPDGQHLAIPIQTVPSQQAIESYSSLLKSVEESINDVNTLLESSGMAAPIQGVQEAGWGRPVDPTEQLRERVALRSEIEKLRSSYPIIGEIEKKAAELGIPSELALVAASHSLFGSKTLTADGRVGVIPLTREQIEQVRKMPGFEQFDPSDPAQSVAGGLSLLASYWQKYKEPSRTLAAFFGSEEMASDPLRHQNVTSRMASAVAQGEAPAADKALSADLAAPTRTDPVEYALVTLEQEARKKGDGASVLGSFYKEAGVDISVLANYLKSLAVPMPDIQTSNRENMTGVRVGTPTRLPGYGTQEAADRMRMIHGQDFLWSGVANLVANLYATRDLDNYIGKAATILYSLRRYSPFDVKTVISRRTGFGPTLTNVLLRALVSLGGYTPAQAVHLISKPTMNELILRSMMTNLFQYTIYPRTGKQLNQVEMRQVERLLPDMNQSPDNFVQSTLALAVLYRLLTWAELSGDQAASRALNAMRGSRGVVTLANDIARILRRKLDYVRAAPAATKARMMDSFRTAFARAMDAPALVRAVLEGKESEFLAELEGSNAR